MEEKKLTELQRSRQRVIGELFKAHRLAAKPAQDQFRHPVELLGHPFALAIPEPDQLHSSTIYFYGWPGYSEPGVDNLLIQAAEQLSCPFLEPSQVYLRVLLVCDQHRNESHHDLYYECRLRAGNVLMCGGCNDFSGAGQHGKRRMDDLFALLAELTGVQIETIAIPSQQSSLGSKYIVAAIEHWEVEGQCLQPPPCRVDG